MIAEVRGQIAEVKTAKAAGDLWEPFTSAI